MAERREQYRVGGSPQQEGTETQNGGLESARRLISGNNNNNSGDKGSQPPSPPSALKKSSLKGDSGIKEFKLIKTKSEPANS